MNAKDIKPLSRPRLRAFTALALLAVTASCVVRSLERGSELGPTADSGGRGNGTAPPLDPIPSDANRIDAPRDLAISLAASQCRWLGRCGSLAVSEVPACIDDSLARLKRFPSPFSPDDALAAGRLTFDRSAAAACAEGYTAPGCSIREGRVALAACANVYRGLMDTDASCIDDRECVSGFCEGASAASGCPGVCRPKVASGELCTPGRAPCAAGAFCDAQSGRCAPRQGAGEPCGSDQACDESLLCRRQRLADGAANVGRCGPPGLRGEDCVTSSDCVLPLYCDSTHRCADRAAEGEDCSTTEECGGTAYCDLLAPLPKCRPWKDVGAACDRTAATASGCPTRSPCAGGVPSCTPSGREGEPCVPYCREGLHCKDAVCVANIPLGGVCEVRDGDAEESCYEGVCSQSVCVPSCPGGALNNLVLVRSTH